MGFDNSGNYTAPAAATDAVPGKVIASADWNNVFTDIQTALTTLGNMNWTNQPRIVTAAGGVTVTTTDRFVVITVSTSAITLPSPSTRTYPVTIVGGITGIFSNFNAVVTPTTGKISGQASVTLSTDFQVINLFPVSLNYVAG